MDDKELAFSDGSLNVAYKNKQISSNQIFPEIGEILSKKISGRLSEKQITVFGNVGLAFQDLVACSIVYNKALILGKGRWINVNNSIPY